MGEEKVSLSRPVAGVCIAAVLWTVMFSPWTAPHVNFWVMMTCSALALTLFSVWVGSFRLGGVKFGPVDIVAGIVLAAVIWGVFWVGDRLSSMMFGFARGQVDMIYGMRDGENPWVLTALMLLVIGPAEEIFWRGYIQESFSRRWGANAGLVVTTLIYALVHISKFNFMLLMAALVAGAFWGLAYRLFPDRLGAIIISHALWDCAVFIWFPI